MSETRVLTEADMIGILHELADLQKEFVEHDLSDQADLIERTAIMLMALSAFFFRETADKKHSALNNIH